jgi:hypothetical protein
MPASSWCRGDERTLEILLPREGGRPGPCSLGQRITSRMSDLHEQHRAGAAATTAHRTVRGNPTSPSGNAEATAADRAGRRIARVRRRTATSGRGRVVVEDSQEGPRDVVNARVVVVGEQFLGGVDLALRVGSHGWHAAMT